MKNFELVTGDASGVIGRVSELHSTYYFKHWGFGACFEIKVATEMSEFIARYNEVQDRIFSIELDGKIEASISIDGSSSDNNIAHLRWFIVSDLLRGQGVGHYLMEKVMSFCRQKQYTSVYLWTFEGLVSARHLYKKYGFTLTKENNGEQWGKRVTEQRFDAIL